ncbi:MAG: TonB-dependent receptor [Bacteroidia bacterium]|jgi:iron complex outermembrane receptor protein|nr:TonB-dependent receptor [Bacteroidia bacterium]
MILIFKHVFKTIERSAFAALLMLIHLAGTAQNFALNGKVSNKNSEALIGAYITVPAVKGIGAITDENGAFSLKVTKFPAVLKISYLGYVDKEIAVTGANSNLKIVLSESSENVLTGALVKASRVTEKSKEAPLTVESIGIKAIKDAPAASFYESLGNLKGVDVTAASLSFRVVNTRGFNSTSPVRSLQLIDGVDNQSPGLNFALGNFLGASDLDIRRVNVIAGASSAFYGPNAFNGVIAMETKESYDFPGLLTELKVGERNLNQLAIRYADYFTNDKGRKTFGYKVNAFYMQAYDWEAENYNPTQDSDNDKNNPGGYDKVNVYGDEVLTNGNDDYTNPTQIYNKGAGLGAFYRTGYQEKDLVDYTTNNLKLNTTLSYRFSDSVQLDYSFNFSTGNTVYQGDNRYRLQGIRFWQNHIELKKKGTYFIRAYSTNEDARETYDIVTTAFRLNEADKPESEWYNRYESTWRRSKYKEVEAIPGYVAFDPNIHESHDSWYETVYLPFIDANKDAISQLHSETRETIDKFRYTPGTSDFDSTFNDIKSRLFTENGTRFYDKSALYHLQGEYKFKPQFGTITVGTSSRLYAPESNGTILNDTGDVIIRNLEAGIYAGIDKRWMADRVILNITSRLDKNQNFDFLASPAASFIYKHRPNHVFRTSFSSAIRNPTLADQYLLYDVGRATLIGNLNGFDSLIEIQSFRNAFESDINLPLLKYYNVDPIRPEQAKTFELGYKGNIADQSVFIDFGYYYTSYKDFIGYNIGIESDFDNVQGLPIGPEVFRVAANATETVTTQGIAIGINYFFKQYNLGGNYSWNTLNKKGTDDPIIPAFNTPEHKFNVSFSGTKLKLPGVEGEHFGFGLNYKWIQAFVFEGSPQFTGTVPTYDMLDAQINYEVPKWSMTFKLGGSNILGLMPLLDKAGENTQRSVFNNLNYQVYGGPFVGRMVYFSVQHNLVFKKN